MNRYELTKDLETGNAIIDKEHRELFNAVNKLFEACSNGSGRSSMNETIQFLNDYVQKHFSHEEQLQQQSEYPSVRTHKAFHEEYKRKLNEITSKISTSGSTIVELGNLNRHISVLIAHIRTEDKKLAGYLNQ